MLSTKRMAGACQHASSTQSRSLLLSGGRRSSASLAPSIAAMCVRDSGEERLLSSTCSATPVLPDPEAPASSKPSATAAHVDHLMSTMSLARECAGRTGCRCVAESPRCQGTLDMSNTSDDELADASKRSKRQRLSRSRVELGLCLLLALPPSPLLWSVSAAKSEWTLARKRRSRRTRSRLHRLCCSSATSARAEVRQALAGRSARAQKCPIAARKKHRVPASDGSVHWPRHALQARSGPRRRARRPGRVAELGRGRLYRLLRLARLLKTCWTLPLHRGAGRH